MNDPLTVRADYIAEDSGKGLGDLKRDLRDLLMAEQNALAKTVVQSVKARREMVTAE